MGGELDEAPALVARADDEVVVGPLAWIAVVFQVVPALGRALEVHRAGIPFVAEGRDRVDTPVEVDAEFGVLEPLGRGVGALQRLEVRLEPGGIALGEPARGQQADSGEQEGSSHDERGGFRTDEAQSFSVIVCRRSADEAPAASIQSPEGIA